MSFDLKTPAISLPDVETVSEAWGSELDSDPEPVRTGNPLATVVRYTQPQSKAIETGWLAGNTVPI